MVQHILSPLSFNRFGKRPPTIIHATNATGAVISAISECLKETARKVSPRDQLTYECSPTLIYIENPTDNVFISPRRQLNYSFMLAEWMWMMCGLNDAELILPFNNKLSMALDPEKLIFNGAYGPRIAEQIEYVVKTLRNDTSSRQAILSIWRERPGASNDIPCTLDFQFLIRDGCLSMITHMRSNDVWLGLPYDLFNFTQIQQHIACQLKVPVGSYTHFVGSLHLYDRNREEAVQVIADSSSTAATVSKHSIFYEVPQTWSVAQFLRILSTIAMTSKEPDAAARKMAQSAAYKSLSVTLGDDWNGWLALLFSKFTIVEPKKNTVAHFVLNFDKYR